ncbi:MAG: hypothetical protein H6988_12980 [Pseudomonadales bacterium]|nr:hypothetical protein [Pseudomonadales bacterium]MCP5191282.1 hypothetical protein [Pseudomonadales bacterium]
MPGPTKKSAVIKSLRGTNRKCRLPEGGVELPPIDELPDPPDWLNVHAVKEWDRLTRLLKATRLLSEVSLSPLAHLCALHGRLAQSWSAGVPPTGHLYAQYLKLCDGFGITPAAAQKIGTVGERAKGNRFSQHGKRP